MWGGRRLVVGGQWSVVGSRWSVVGGRPSGRPFEGRMSTHSRSMLVLLFALAAFVPAGAYAQAPAARGPVTKASEVFAEKSANVFRRFNGDGVKTLEFYGEVLGFRDIGTATVAPGQGVSRYQVGPSQLKFTKAGANAKFTRGAITD